MKVIPGTNIKNKKLNIKNTYTILKIYLIFDLCF